MGFRYSGPILIVVMRPIEKMGFVHVRNDVAKRFAKLCDDVTFCRTWIDTSAYAGKTKTWQFDVNFTIRWDFFFFAFCPGTWALLVGLQLANLHGDNDVFEPRESESPFAWLGRELLDHNDPADWARAPLRTSSETQNIKDKIYIA